MEKEKRVLNGLPIFRALMLMTLVGWVAVLLGLFAPVHAQEQGSEFKVAIMQAQKGMAQKFRPLENYLKRHGVNISFVGAPNYPAAAKMFADGRVDGMFSGSGVAGSLIIKDLAYPVVRPVDREGRSTYWAVVIAPNGAPKFINNADYFDGKTAIFCALASSGEFFYRSIPEIEKSGATLIQAPSHGAALAGLAKGAADVAIVKNRVWDNLKAQYPELNKVGEDSGENPNGTLIVSKKADPQLVKKCVTALMALSNEHGPEAAAVHEAMGIRGYVATTADDFAHTLVLLKKAGVTPDFNFSY